MYRVGFALAALLGALVGCTQPKVVSMAPERRALGSDLLTYEAPKSPAVHEGLKTPVEEPDGGLALRRALALALMSNPELAAFSWEVRAAEARVIQAKLPPNPELEFSVEEFAGSGALTGFKAAEFALQLSQVIELGGKRVKRTQVAQYERDLSAWDFEVKRLDVFTQTAQAYIEALAAQKRLEVAESTLRLAERMHEIVTERVKSGKVSPLEQSQAEVILSTSRIEAERSRRELATVRRSLAASWGSTEPKFSHVEGDLEAMADVPTFDQIARHVAQNPDIARWAAEVALRRAGLTLATSKRIPDLAVGAGAQHFNESDDNSALLGVSLELPIFDRNQGGILEARYLVARSRQEQRAVEVRVKTELYRAHQTLALAHSEALTLRQGALAPAQRAFEAAQEGYRQGKWAHLEVLDAQRTLFEVQRQYINALAAYHKAVADAERLIGQRLDSAAAKG